MILSVIIPVFNEKNTIKEILKRVEAVDLSGFSFEKEIIIIDDGSTDGTKEILEGLKNKYKIIYHYSNQGKGSAIKSGLEKATGGYVIIQDADLEYNPEDYKKILECALKNNAKVVYGSRRLCKQNKFSNLFFYLGGVILVWLTNLLYGTKITDESTGYKFFETKTLRSARLKCKKFDFCPEVTAKFAKKGIKIYEVPISYKPRNRKEKKITWTDGLEAVFTLIKYKFFD